MKPVNIDFLPPRRPPRRAWQSLAVVGLGLLAALVMLGSRLQALRTLETEVAVLQTQARAVAAAPVPTPALPASAPWVPPPYDVDARRALQEGRFLTAGALTQMERVMVPGATPSSVELDARTGTVQVQVDFKEKETLFAYLEALNRQDESGAPVRWQLLQVRPVAGVHPQGMAVIVSHWVPHLIRGTRFGICAKCYGRDLDRGGLINIGVAYIEVIIRQMLRRVQIANSGDSTYIVGEQVERSELFNTNERL